MSELDIDALAGSDDGAVEDLSDQQQDLQDDGKQVDVESKEEGQKLEQKEPQQEDKRVPLATLLEERAQRKQLQERLEKLSGLEQEIRALRDKKSEPTQKADDDPEPDYLKDPKAYVDWQRRTAEKSINSQLEPLRQQHEQQTAASEQNRMAEQIVSKASEYETEFVQEFPDYLDALQHIRNVRMAEAQILGIPPQQLSVALRNNELQLAAYALQNGKNPALLAYNLAKSLGYVQKSEQQKPQMSEDEKIQMAAKRDKAQGMGGQGGIDDITNASDDVFEEVMSEMFGKRR